MSHHVCSALTRRFSVVLLTACCLLIAACAHAETPVADFTGSPPAGPPPLAVSFTDLSANTPTSWLWDFGDSATSAAQNPSHTYSSLGSYNVSLTAANADGQDTETKLDFVIATTNRIVNVSTSADLRAACWDALDGDVILVADGTYPPTGNPFLRLENKTDITLRGASGRPSQVVLQGYGWDSKTRNDDILWLWGSQNITVAFLTFEEANDYGIKLENSLLNGLGLQNIHIRHCNFRNIGTRMIKGTGANLTPVQTGSIRFCHFENTKIPPKNWSDGGNYISAIDCMCLKNWTISDNRFKNIKGYSGGGRGAIFAWVECENVTAERNLFTGCDRSIAYGNPSSSSVGPLLPHMTNGMIRNNFIVAGADTGIEICWVNGIKAYQNTVLTPDPVNGKGIHYHWNDLIGIHIAHNIVRGQIYGDEGADVTLENNITSGIEDSWFADVNSGDLHLTALATPAIDQVTRLADCTTDFDGEDRPTTPGLTDIGADERLVGPVPPVADFSANPTSGNAPLTVYFTDLSSNSPTSWDWTFGDGGSSQQQNPSHQYTAVNTYTVGLTVANPYGQDTETKPDYIEVTQGQAPVADFVGVPTNGPAPLTVNFTDQSTNSPTSWDWTFGDGGSSQQQNPSHDYTIDNTYTVSLTVANAYGQDTETKPDYINVATGGQQDYFCDSLDVESGTLLSGDHTSVHASDDVYLQVQSIKITGKYGTVLVYYFNTGLSSLSALTVTSESHPSDVPQRQRIWLYDFTTSQWVEVDVRDITTTSDETTVVSVPTPAPYLSGAGEVRVRIRQGERLNGVQWTHYIDLVKTTASP